MNPETNKFEPVYSLADQFSETFPRGLLRADGSAVPKHWSTFKVGEEVVIKGYTFRVEYIGETAILFEPVGIPDLGSGPVEV